MKRYDNGGIIQRIKIHLYHHGHLEHNGVVKLAQVKAGDLLDLLQDLSDSADRLNENVSHRIELRTCQNGCGVRDFFGSFSSVDFNRHVSDELDRTLPHLL